MKKNYILGSCILRGTSPIMKILVFDLENLETFFPKFPSFI